MRLRRSLTAGSLVVLAMALVHVALAQPRKHARPKPAPAPAAADAGSGDNPYGEEPASPGSSPAPAGAAAGDAGPVPPPPARPEVGDGGVKPSPLNPAPNELPPQSPPPTPDYDKLLGDVSALRARVAAVTDTLFRSRIAIALEADGSHARIARLTVSLDDGVVYTSPPNAQLEGATIYEHGVAPGRHAVTIDVDRRDDRDETFRTAQRSRFLVDVPKDQRLELQLRIDDDSNMGGDFPSDHSGRYDLRVRAKASAKPVGK